MNPILLAVLLLAGLGLLCGLILAVASVVFAVPRNEKAVALREVLPGANCGACGFSGCDGYAEAMARGEAKPGLCSPGGAEAAAACGELLGVQATLQAKFSVVRCGGCDEAAARKMEYHGIPTCRAASRFFGGDKRCRYGCLGYGDCAAVCPQNAISLANGISRIDPALCNGCGQCVAACPKQLIVSVPRRAQAVVQCFSEEKGPAVLKACKKGCIGCKKCEKACEYGAVTVTNYLAHIDPEKCTACGACVTACLSGCIHMEAKTDE